MARQVSMVDREELTDLHEAAAAAQDALGVLVERLEALLPVISPIFGEPTKAVGDGRMSTSLRIDPERLEALKVIALREQVRVNELVLRGIDHIIALHNQGRAA